MANKERGEVDLVAGGETYTLRFTFNEIAEIETRLNKGANDILAMLRDPKDFRVSNWRVLLWGALQDRHEGTSIKDAGEIMRAAGLDEVIARLNEAMELGFPERQRGDGENPQKASQKAGSLSS